MMTPPLSIWARPFFVAHVEVSTAMSDVCSGVALVAGIGWPRGPRPFEPLAALARSGLSHGIPAIPPECCQTVPVGSGDRRRATRAPATDGARPERAGCGSSYGDRVVEELLGISPASR